MFAAAAGPYPIARLASLFLSFAFGVVGLAMVISAFVKSNREKDEIRRIAPQGASVTVDTSDVLDAGGVVAGFCAAIACVSLASLALLLSALAAPRHGASWSTRTLALQGGLLSFCTVALFAALVAMTDFVANRGARVSASIDGVPLPAVIIQSVEHLVGLTPVYREIGYLKLAVILPWIAFFFGATSSALSLVAASRVRALSRVEDPISTGAKDNTANSIMSERENEKKG